MQLKIFLVNLNFLSKNKPEIKKGIGDSYFYSGLRYSDYFKRLNNNELTIKMVNNLKNSNIKYYRESFDKNSLNYLREKFLRKAEIEILKLPCFLIQFLIFSYNQMIMNIYTLN